MRFNIFDKAEVHALLAAFGILVINGIQGGCLSEPVIIIIIILIYIVPLTPIDQRHFTINVRLKTIINVI